MLPLVAAAIGWFTNFVAVRMIFRPHEPIRFAGLTVQGLLPKRKAEFAASIGETVEEHLVSADDIRAILDDPVVAESIESSILARMDDFLANKLAATSPMLGAFLGGPVAQKIKAGIVAEISTALANVVDSIGEHIDERLDLKAIVEEKILAFDMHKLEAIVLRVAKRELVAIEVLGAVLGLIVGILQLLVLRAID